MASYYLILDGSGNIAGGGLTLDETIPAGRVACTQAQAARPFDWAVVNGEIVPSPNLLVNTRAAQISILSSACQQQIVSGFSSSSLGSAYTYASGDIDQRNIVQSAQSTKGGLLACQNAAGVWGIEPHTQDQSQQALEDFVAARDATRLKLVGLVAKVNAATTVADVQAVVWVNGDATPAAITPPPSKASKKSGN